MNAKDTWPVVKFIVAATGFNRQDARTLLEQLPKECHSQLYLRARAWDRDSSAKATEGLEAIVGTTKLGMLAEATQGAITPSHKWGDDEGEPAPRSQGATGHGKKGKKR